MSAYDDAVAYLDAEVHPRCDYDIYSDMRDIVDEMEAENNRLREFASCLVEYVDPAGYQDICNIECPASTRCRGKSTCAFPDWAIERARDLGIEVDE